MLLKGSVSIADEVLNGSRRLGFRHRGLVASYGRIQHAGLAGAAAVVPRYAFHDARRTTHDSAAAIQPIDQITQRGTGFAQDQHVREVIDRRFGAVDYDQAGAIATRDFW